MYEKLSSGDLNPDLYLPYSISTYICGVTITLKVRGDYWVY